MLELGVCRGPRAWSAKGARWLMSLSPLGRVVPSSFEGPLETQSAWRAGGGGVDSEEGPALG